MNEEDLYEYGEHTAYCVKCNEPQFMYNPKVVQLTSKHGDRWALQSKCPQCKHTLTRIIKKADVERETAIHMPEVKIKKMKEINNEENGNIQELSD